MSLEMQDAETLSHRTTIQHTVLSAIRQAVFLISLPFGILDFVLPIYGKRIGADAVQIGLFFSAFSLMIVLLRPLVGGWLDRYGRRPFFLAGILGYSLTMLVFAFSGQVWSIVLARIIQGISSSMLWLAAQAMVADTATAGDRGRSFGGVTQSNSQGIILGTFIGFSVLMSINIQASWTPLFLGYAVVCMGALLLARSRLVETKSPAQVRAQHPIRWSRPWVLLMLVTLVTGASWSMVSPVLMIYLQEKFSTDVPTLAYAFLPSGMVWALLPSRLGSLADRFGRKPLMVLGMAMAAVTSFMVPTLSSLVMLAVMWAVQALCYAAGDPAEQALVADLTGGDQRGRGYGLYAMAGSLGATIGPLAGGWLYQTVSQGAPFYANGFVLAICTLVLALFLKEPSKPVAVESGAMNNNEQKPLET
jgi:DHA1 family multidrug resistance protein-like MFS transporter